MKNLLHISPSSMAVVFLWVVLTTANVTSASSPSIPGGTGGSLPGGSAQRLMTPTIAEKKRRGGGGGINNRRHPHRRRGGEQQHLNDDGGDDDDDILSTSTKSDKTHSTTTASSSSSTESLVFIGDCKFTSEPCPVENKGELIDFFNRQDTMKLFLSAGGKRPCRNIPITTEIRELWKQASQQHYDGTTSPDYQNDDDDDDDDNNSCNDVMVMATETDAQFPGFKMITTVLNGCKRFEDKNTGMSRYEFCMIGDKKRIVGSPPVVWLVKKLTGQKETDDGSSTDNNDKFQLSETKAKSVISIIEQPNQEQQQQHKEVQPVSSNTIINNYYQNPKNNNNNNNSSTSSRRYYSFQLDLEFATSVKFPKMLLKMLPASKSKVEERGTASVKKAIMKDASSAVQVARETWMNIIQQQEEEQAD